MIKIKSTHLATILAKYKTPETREQFTQVYNVWRAAEGKGPVTTATIKRYANGGSGYEKGLPDSISEFIIFWKTLDRCAEKALHPKRFRDQANGFLDSWNNGKDLRYSFYTASTSSLTTESQAMRETAKIVKAFAEELNTQHIVYSQVTPHTAFKKGAKNAEHSYKTQAIFSLTK